MMKKWNVYVMQQIGLVLQDTIAQNEIMISMIGFRQQNL